MMPFTETEAERQRAGDPRPSLEARYVSREAWAARLAEATHRLVAERLLLAEDGDRLVAAARESWDVYQALREPAWKPSGLACFSGPPWANWRLSEASHGGPE